MIKHASLSFLALALQFGGTAQAAEPARTDSLPVGRCVNMGNHLEAPKEGAWGGRLIADDDFEIIAKAGFNTIRLPVRWSTHAAKKAPYTIDKVFMARIKHFVGRARAAGLNVILNSHHFDEIHENPAKHAPKLAGMWRQIATTFAREPNEHVWFEIENEPHNKFDHTNLLKTLNPALAAIRATNPVRPVIIGGEFWSGIDSLATLPLPNDPHIVPTFHYYEPFDFTHQGAGWVNPSPAMGRVYGTDADIERLVKDVKKVRDYIKRTGKTPFMGEFGAHSTIPQAERVTYQRTMRVAFDNLKIGMCAWGFTNTFPLYDSAKKEWVPGMRAAMGLPE
jgi:endoglucanase